jgi:spore maturation protein CgeB
VRLVVFGLAISSSWGNGHATLWRGLVGALAARGHSVVFFERDVPWYAGHRDLQGDLPGLDLVLYRDWAEVRSLARAYLADCDAAFVTSYCADGLAATDEVLASRAARRVFYDLDAPVTLARVRAGEAIPWLGAEGLRGFDLVLSYAGGPTLDGLRDLLGARRAAPLYGSVDPAVHAPAPPRGDLRGDLSYLGTTRPTARPPSTPCSSRRPAGGRSARSSSAARSTRPTSRGGRTSTTSGTSRRRTTRPSTGRRR